MKKPSGVQSDEPQTLVDIAAIDQLAKIVAKYGLTEIEVELGELHVRLARDRTAASTSTSNAAAMQTPAAIAKPVSAESVPSAESASTDLAGAVKSPMVGTAYLRPSPEARPFVELGSLVKTGDKLLLVEAMKTFNDIVAPRAGKVIDILVVDGAPVEYGQPLVVLE